MARSANSPEMRDISSLEDRNVSDLRTGKEMGEEYQGKILDYEAGKIRNNLLERLQKDTEGTFSEREKQVWQGKLDNSYQDVSKMRGLKEEFETHLQKVGKLRQRFQGAISLAETEKLLRRATPEKLTAHFSAKDLEEKEKMVEQIEKDIEDRRNKLKEFYKVEKNVQDKRRESFEGAENYTQKLEILEAAKEESKAYQSYRKLFQQNRDCIGTKTMTEYFEWFLTLSDEEQRHALAKAEKEDIAPRKEAMEIHKALPREHQRPGFKELGLSERHNVLSEIETSIEGKYRDTMREKGKSVFAEKTILFCEKAFMAPEQDTRKRMLRKAEFLKALPGHIKLEEKLRETFKEFPPKIINLLDEEFSQSDFDEKQKIIKEKAPKMTELMNKAMNRMNNKIDPHIQSRYLKEFNTAKTIKEMESVTKEAELAQASKKRYFEKWETAKAKGFFRSEKSVYERWYAESVDTHDKADKAEKELATMINVRQTIHESTQKLPPHIRARANEDAPLANREKQLHKLQDIAKAYQSTIPFLLTNAKGMEDKKDWNGALKFYMEALKLDPDSPELKVLAAALRQKGGKIEDKPSGPEDKNKTENILQELDSAPKMTQQMEELARKQILLDLAQQHKDHVQAGAGTTDSRSRASIKSLNKEDQGLAESILDEFGDTHVVDEKGFVRQKVEIKTEEAQQLEKTDLKLKDMMKTKRLHKQADVVQSGLAEISFVDKSGQEQELTTARDALDAQRKQMLNDYKTQVFSRLQTGKTKFTPEQIKALEESMDLKGHLEDEEEEYREAA
ncbi:MAG: hypothetical protein WCW30_02050 [Candidatus Gracilibacteria bacterium]